MTDEVSMTANELLSKMKELDQGDLMRGLLELVFQAGLEAERDEHIGVGRYERGEERSDTRSGYKPRRLETLVGTLKLRRPQTRDGMRSGLLENYQRMDQALLTMATEMYANGVSTRRVKKVLEDTIGTSVSAATVSNANRLLDKGVSALRSRPLGEYPALIVDARFDKVRRDGAVRSMALLVVTGVDSDGYRHVLDFKAVEGERGAYWEDLFQGLKRRGLHGVLYMVSDDHAGLRDALAREFVGATWQRCQTHITRNILKRTPSAWKSAVASRVKDCFTAPTEEQARERLDELVKFGDKVSSGLGVFGAGLVFSTMAPILCFKSPGALFAV